MRKALSLASVLLGAALTAQSPLTTNFVGDNGGSVGGGVYFDLTVNPAAGVGVVALDVHLTSPAGTPGSIELWARSGTAFGAENSTTGWTRRAVGSVVSAGRFTPTRCLFPAPFTLPVGLNGIALCSVGVAQAYTNGTGSNQTYSTAELTLQAGTATRACFGPGAPFSPRVVNCRIYYGTEVFATVTRAGRGCNAAAVSFYAEWAGGAFDMANRSWRATPNANGGVNVTVSPATFVAPTGTGLALTDDSLSGALPLGFTWSLTPGVTTTAINVCSNGFIHLQPNAVATDFLPTPARALQGGPRLAALWCDLEPDGTTNTANVFFETAPGVARVTWLNVPHFNGTGTTTVQVVFTDGSPDTVDVLFLAAGHPVAPQMTGYSPGANNRDPGNRDLTLAIPFTTATDLAPLDQGADLLIIGTTPNLLVADITAGSLSGIELLGLPSAPIDLTAIGMPGCFLNVTPLIDLPFAISGSNAATPLPIPNDVNLLASQVAVQALTVTPGANTLNLRTSNAVVLTIGNL